MIKQKIAVIGAGNMGDALITGMVRSGEIDPQQITAVDLVEALLLEQETRLGVQTHTRAEEIVENQDVIILAVKPQVWTSVVANFKDLLSPSQLVISIMGGVRLAALEQELGELPIVRVMPNILACVGASGAALCSGTHVDASQMDLALVLLGLVGAPVVLSETQLDAVTGLSGSGPAYVFLVIDALADGGVKMGLPKEIALKLAVQTVLGAAKMVLEKEEHPAILKDQVTSAGGTTIAGLHAMEQSGVRAGLMNAVEAATKRSQELGA
ncbi:MAG: pyrroline-5-carboxylate reductase [bacterium]|nr:pyrroline-5-carboxylate reductase [bacterium]